MKKARLEIHAIKFALISISFFLVTPQLPANSNKTFSQEAWETIHKDFQKHIVLHPFNQELMKGTLSSDRFAHYSNQDQYYLREFAKMLALLATKLENPTDIKVALKLSQEALAEEILVSNQAADFKTAGKKPAEMMPATLFYVSYLQSLAAFGSAEELAAALLPCYWIYQVLGEELAKGANVKGPYMSWIQTYTSLEYRKSVEEIRLLTDRLAQKTSPPIREKMLVAFRQATRLESKFWQGAYQLEKWDF